MGSTNSSLYARDFDLTVTLMPGIGLGDFYARMLEIYFLIIRVDFLVKNVMLALQFIYVYVSIVANCD